MDIDTTLITAHSEKERASGNYKGGFGFHPLLAYGDENREALAGICGPYCTRRVRARPGLR